MAKTTVTKHCDTNKETSRAKIPLLKGNEGVRRDERSPTLSLPPTLLPSRYNEMDSRHPMPLRADKVGGVEKKLGWGKGTNQGG